MLDRASVIDEQFIKRVREADFPALVSSVKPSEVGLSKQIAIDLFDSQIKSRHLDCIARKLKEKGLAYYTIGSSGHEGNAVFAQVFRSSDMAFLHYRSAAFYIQRAKQNPGLDPVQDILLSLVASASDPISGGRHKVFGSVPLTIPPQTSTIASHLPKALGTALSITRAKELAISSNLPADAIILCSFGDASFNHASAQTTLNACAWIRMQSYPLPIVFLCEDNGWGISVPTPSKWIETNMRFRSGFHYLSCDGNNLADLYDKALQAQEIARIKKQPVFIHMRCVRLLGHAGSDIESQYNNQQDIEASEANDPLLCTAGLIYREGWMTLAAIIKQYKTNQALIEAKAEEVIAYPKLDNAQTIMSALLPKKRNKRVYLVPDESLRQRVFDSTYNQLFKKRNLSQLINLALTDLMMQYPNMLIFGEDVGKKGGVYRVTADLQTRFGQRRVFDTLLDETTILGTAIGLAHNGFLPVPEIQFLAYLHNAEDQLRGEAATLPFFSDGQYQNPMVIRIAGLAYQKGFGGHFHNDNSIAVLRDIPSLLIACPSNGYDAALMLRTAMKLAQQEGRIIVFLEPIALYMTKDLHQPGDNGWLCEYPPLNQTLEWGELGIHGEGDTVIISYANGYYLSRKAAQILKNEHKKAVKVIDLRWLKPLPMDALLQELQRAKRILIVDEGRKSGSLSEELITLCLEKLSHPVILKRLTGKDCFIPLGEAWQHLLPDTHSIINAVLALCAVKREKERGRFVMP